METGLYHTVHFGKGPYRGSDGINLVVEQAKSVRHMLWGVEMEEDVPPGTVYQRWYSI